MLNGLARATAYGNLLPLLVVLGNAERILKAGGCWTYRMRVEIPMTRIVLMQIILPSEKK